MARRFTAFSSISDSISTYGCAAVGVMISVATDGIAGLVVGTFGGIGCSNVTSNQVAPVAGVAQSANQYGKCLELRMHREGDQWVADDNGWTMTDSPDYCG